MKKALLLLLTLSFFTQSFSSFVVKPAPELNANRYFIPITNDKKISLMELSTINVKDFEKLSGKHLGFFERLSFKSSQKKLRNGIKSDGTVTDKRLKKFIQGDHSTGFHLGGFALGFLLGLIGVLFAYVSGGDPEVKRNRVKWSWIGFGVFAVLYLVLVIAFLSSVY